MTGFLLHSDAHGAHGEFLSEHLGAFGAFLDEVVLHAVLDTLKPLVFLFFTYLLMEFIEHKASEKTMRLMNKAGGFGPVIGGALGALPQCGFSAAAANLYTGRVISLGTLAAVFISTSDEMLPILLGTDASITAVISIVVYKILVGIAVGFAIDLTLRLCHRSPEKINIDEICDNDECHCERGILYSALHHTVSVSILILLVTLCLNALIFFLGEHTLEEYSFRIPVLSHLSAALFGLIPNCAASVTLTKLAASGFISSGAMISGLCSGSGIGILLLFRMNRRLKENVIFTLVLTLSGVVFGLIAEFLPFLAL